MSPESSPPKEHGLIRALGVPALTANIVNTTIGAGIFVLPALVANGLGAASPVAYGVCAIAMGLFVTSFAMAGSRVSLTGGLYAYVEVAFGRYVGFLAGILYFLLAVLSASGVVNVLATSVGVLAPPLATKVARFIIILSVFGFLAAINIRGVRTGVRVVGAVTLIKLLPLIVFVLVGIFFIRPESIAWAGWPGSKPLGESVLLLIFAFMGIETALVPSGEIKAPARTVPRAIFTALAITTVLYVMIQLVAQGVLGSELAKRPDAPLAEAAVRFLGVAGRTLLLAGATVSWRSRTPISSRSPRPRSTMWCATRAAVRPWELKPPPTLRSSPSTQPQTCSPSRSRTKNLRPTIPADSRASVFIGESTGSSQ